MATTTPSAVLSSTAEAQLILQATEQVLAGVAAPLTLSSWPLFVFEVVQVVYSAVQMSTVDRKGVVQAILQNLVNRSTVLTAAERLNLNALIAQTTSAAVDALLKANSVVDTWVEREGRTWWTRCRRWCCCKPHSA